MAHLLTVEHITSLRSLFEQHDAEHVGSLSSAQLLRLLHACGETQLSEADVQTTLKEITGQDNAHCTFESFVYTMTQPFSPISDPPQPHSTEFVLSAATRQTLQAAFRAMDGDGDGRLNSEDVWEALMAVGERVEVDEAEAIVAAIDTTNKQGKKSQNKAITKRDFIRVMTAQ